MCPRSRRRAAEITKFPVTSPNVRETGVFGHLRATMYCLHDARLSMTFTVVVDLQNKRPIRRARRRKAAWRSPTFLQPLHARFRQPI